MFKQWETGIQEVGSRAYAYFTDGTYGMDNAGIVAGDRYAFAFDTLPNAALTLEFAQKAKELIGYKPIRYFAHSHHNPDHTIGGAVYFEASVLGHRSTLNQLKFIPGKNDWPVDPTGGYILNTEIVFDSESILIDLGNRWVELIHMGNCHSGSDTVLYVPDSKLLFCGDLIFNYVWPDGFKSNVPHWIETLDRLYAMDVEKYVPGHGPLADKVDLKRVRDCLQLLYNETVKGYKAGLHPREIARTMEQGEYHDWLMPHRRVIITDIVYRMLEGKNFTMAQWDINEEIQRVRSEAGIIGPQHKMFCNIDHDNDPDQWEVVPK